MNLVEICITDPATAPMTGSAADAIEAMIRRGIGATVILDSKNIVAGILTERDVLRKIALSGRDPHQIPVTEVMSAPVILATRKTTPAEAVEFMIQQQKRHMPVVEDDGKLIGVLSIRHVLERKVHELTREIEQITKV
jgi:CBS domain-containing protein